MLSKFSVKKPYTVVVGIILVIVLGVVSVMKTTTDLLPDMNLAYALVITTDIGASPEEIESQVTEPIESSMATISNIKNVSSMSQDNYSMVILEFEQTANMDAVTVEMRESLDQLSAYWDDSVGNPTIMKLNPNMMPIMVAAADVDGMTSDELTNYVEDKLLPEVKSVEGVASVTAIGEVTSSIQVTLDQEKIDGLNEQIATALTKQFVDAQDEMDSAKNELDSQSGILSAGEDQLLSSTSDTINKLTDQKINLMQTEKELESKLSELQESKTTLTQTVTQLTTLQQSVGQLQDAINSLLEVEEPTELQEAQLKALQGQLDGIASQLPEGVTVDNLGKQLTQAKQGLIQVKSGITQIKKSIKSIEAGIETINTNLSKLNAAQISGASSMGSASAQLSNGQQKLDEAQSTLDDSKETALKKADLNSILTIDTLKGILTAQNFSMPAGYVEQDGEKYLVKLDNQVTELDSLKDMVLLDMGIDDLEPITLADVATVELSDNSDEVYAKINDNAGVMLSIQKQTGYSTGDVTDAINEKFEKLEEGTEGLHLTALMDQGIYIKYIVNSVVQNMIVGGILAILILFLFLKDIKPTIVIAFSIPISVIFALVLMYFSGITLNVISMSGLALGVGMLVDNSIVVIENIYRMRKEGKSAKVAAVEGAKQVTGAIIASTLTTICVFAPIIFTEGITRQLFVDMGLTIAYALLASLIISLTLVPMMAAGVLTKADEKKHPLFDKIREFYGGILPAILRFKPVVLILVVVLLGLSFWGAMSNGTSFMPDMDSTQMTVTVTPPKDASFDDTTALADQVCSKIQEIKDVDTVGAMTGGDSTSSMSSLSGSSEDNSISIYVILKEDKDLTNKEIGTLIEGKTADMDCEVKVSTSTMDLSSIMSSGITIEVRGQDIDTLQKIAGDMGQILTDTKGTMDVDDGLNHLTKELKVTVDEEKAAAYGMTSAQIYQVIQGQIADPTSATKVSMDTNQYDVYVNPDEETKITKDTLKDLTFTYTDKEGNEEEIPISKVADITNTETLSTIYRDDQTRYISVTAAVDDSHNVGLLSRSIQKKIDKYELPSGYSIKMVGEDETINDAMKQILLMLALAVVFIYLIMVAQFQSLLSPFIIMFTIPLAFTGGFLALFLSGKEVSVIAAIGFVMLSGVIVNNGIVLVDYMNQLRREGMGKKEAIVEAGKTRLRPIFMTALTTILAMSTMALGMGMGADMVQPMAIVVIGGMLYGTLLTLFVVPCIYDLVNREKNIVEEEF